MKTSSQAKNIKKIQRSINLYQVSHFANKHDEDSLS